jgi:hypothetical protein
MIKVVPPTWYLKVLCPCCGQGHPVLISCPGCGYVAAWCDELGNAFLNPNDLLASLTWDEAARCPACGARSLEEFVLASSLQIRKAGLEGLFH